VRKKGTDGVNRRSTSERRKERKGMVSRAFNTAINDERTPRCALFSRGKGSLTRRKKREGEEGVDNARGTVTRSEEGGEAPSMVT